MPAATAGYYGIIVWMIIQSHGYEIGIFFVYGRRCRADEKTVAIHLILHFWKWDAQYHDVDHYHWINNTRLLSVGDMQAMAGEVW